MLVEEHHRATSDFAGPELKHPGKVETYLISGDKVERVERHKTTGEYDRQTDGEREVRPLHGLQAIRSGALSWGDSQQSDTTGQAETDRQAHNPAQNPPGAVVRGQQRNYQKLSPVELVENMRRLNREKSTGEEKTGQRLA